MPRRLNGDPTRLRQVLMNLLSNALKFTAEGHVAVRVQRRFDEGGHERLLYSVSDSGIGISAQAQKTLFESFSQADSAPPAATAAAAWAWRSAGSWCR